MLRRQFSLSTSGSWRARVARQRLSTSSEFRWPHTSVLHNIRSSSRHWARVPVLTDIFRSNRNLPWLSDRREKCWVMDLFPSDSVVLIMSFRKHWLAQLLIMMMKWSFWLTPGWRWGSPVRLTYPAIYVGRKGPIWGQAVKIGMYTLRSPQLHAIGQPKPPKGRGWAGTVNVVIGTFSQSFPKALSRQRVQIKAQYPRPYKEWDDSPHSLKDEVFV